MRRTMVRNVAITAALVATAGALLPLGTRDLRSRARPVNVYEEAIRRVALMRAAEQPIVNRFGTTVLMAHGGHAAKITVLLHGLTATPYQMQLLGDALYARGNDVFIPRLPLHGERGRTITALSALTADTLRSFADDVIDIARGLADTVDVLGLSGGGTLAAWIAQHRAEVRRVVIVSPALALSRLPRALGDPAMQTMARLPNLTVGATSDTMKRQVYAGFSTHAVAQTMRLGAEVRSEADRVAPAARAIVMVTNGNDVTVDAGAALALAGRWMERGAAITHYNFDSSLGLPHDLVDRDERCADPGVVYPALIALLEGRAPAGDVRKRVAPEGCLNR
ncbi:MAG: alpha/beta fold hydrolase [bacterium]